MILSARFIICIPHLPRGRPRGILRADNKGMGWFVKIFFGLLGIAVIGGFVINRMPDLKRRVVEVINPAAKEGRLLGELNAALEGLGGNTDPAKSKELVDKARGVAAELTSHNQKNSGIIKQQVGKIVDALLDRTPYPADHLQTPADATASPVVCPPEQKK